MHFHAGAILDSAAHLIQVREIQVRINTLGVQVQGQRHQVYVAGSLSLPKKAALYAIGPCKHGELSGGDPRSPVVVGVHRDRDILAPT